MADSPTRILLVDDSDSIRTTLRLTLEFQGYAVTEACDGDEGLEALQNGEFDLMFSDLAMPGLDGVELIRRAREVLKLTSLPIFLLSAEDREGKNRALAAGATACIDKPFSPQQILDLVAEQTGG